MTRAGHVLSGRYRLDERLGFGGMGEVWRCADLLLGRTVALKLLRPDVAAHPEFQGRFMQEARTLAALGAEGIVRVHDFGRDGEVAYLVMEYVPGRTLADIAAGGRLTASFALPVLAAVARALGAAHRAGIVHRDIKPGNIIVGGDGRATLVDFGIAYTPEQTRHTAAGEIIGTLGYASPEQLHGERLTPAADVYALGAVAHRCLAGTPPFEGTTASVITGHLHRPPPPLPPDVPTAVASVVAKALAKTPAERYTTAGELADAFDAASRGGATAVTSRPPSSPRRRRRRVLAALVAGAAAVAALVLAAALLPHGTNATVNAPSPAPGGSTITGLATGTLIDSGDGVIYRLGEDGTLSWYRHTDPEGGAATWTEGSGRTVAEGWRDRFATVG